MISISENAVHFFAVSLVSGFPLGFILAMMIFAVRSVVSVFKQISS